ncbi:MAG: hypothetical protein V5A88_10315 [Candidatus Thermoplasmatota archaeon]
MSSNLKSEKLFEMAIRSFINRSDRDLENCKAAKYFDDMLTRIKDDNARRMREELGVMPILDEDCSDCEDDGECLL